MRKGDLFNTTLANRNYRVRYTGKKRPPKAGEWYISGAIPTGYHTTGDLSYPYHIGELVEIETITYERVKRVIRG